MLSFELIGHRGYPSRYPENTLLGFEQAIDAGARYIEADVQLSADAIPFVFHDRDLTRLCAVQGTIHQLRAEQLLRCSPHAPEAFASRYKGIPMLRLDQLVKLLQRQPQVTLFLELKRGMLQTLAPALAVATVIELIEPVRSQIVLISFSIKLLACAQQQGWQRLAPVLTRWNQLGHRSVQALTPEWLFLDQQQIPQGVNYTAANPKLAIYEVSDINIAQALSERGVHWIETDSIGEMLTLKRCLLS
tara:strand:- start:2708 stop:3448 length:741 start_codon:yes stop_codon:yes gene_type:complete